ncbi:MAG: 50S ribosomal protein L29 [Nanoarchaeota archaeon]|nr:50S ribosomal protein L29 [Nanoarchaeota archaeon]
MAILRPKEIRKLSAADRQKRLHDLHLELAKERGQIAVGASTTSPGKIAEIRKTIARVHTINNEEKRKGASKQ